MSKRDAKQHIMQLATDLSEFRLDQLFLDLESEDGVSVLNSIEGSAASAMYLTALAQIEVAVQTLETAHRMIEEDT